MNKNKAVLLSRVSSREQQENGFSLKAQTELILEYAKKHELKIVEKFIFAESAKDTTERKFFKEILEYLDSHEDVHFWLIEKVDRATRNFDDFILVNQWLNKHEENKLIFVKQNLTINKNSLAHEKFQ